MKTLLVLSALALASCSSTHDLGQGPSMMGGGVYHEELRPGLHYIVVKSNVAPWKNQDAVAQQWRQEADRACAGERHQDLRIEDRVDEDLAPMNAIVIRLRYLVTVRKGYALCAAAGLSEESALRYLDSRP